VTDVADLQTVVDKLKPEERKRLEDLGLLKDGKITPLELAEADLTPEKLFSEDARKRLLSRPQGPTTEDGLRYAMYMSTEFMYQQLLGNNAAAIFDPRTGLRFMNDLATYEIFWHFLYLTVLHGVELTADGKYSKAGDRVTPELFVKLLDERRETVKELFKKLGTEYEKTNAELVLSVLKRQVVEERDGRLVPQPRWIKYGSRVLLSIIEESDTDRTAILGGIFTADREDLVEQVKKAGTSEARARAEKVLRAYDFVYDAREGSIENAA
jgi:Malate synthase